jgi:1-Cys peroxiredoxin 6|mmetsp:Transcript_1019/g.119  ORF Transcript_1019/g.119 Transcript_1019/m.119 type:complete len:85 (-) Transcript_1019:840-1094(-)
MLDPDAKDSQGIPLTCRAVFCIGPDSRLKFSIIYPATTGRNFNEILRAIDSVQLTKDKPIATPVNWVPGDDVIVAPSLSQEDAN